MSEKSVKPSRKSDIVKVILAILAVLLGTYIFVDPSKEDFQFNPGLVKKIDSLQAINDALSKENIELDSLVTTYVDVINGLDDRLEAIVKSKDDVREYYRKKLLELQDQSVTDVDTFFMNRYEYVSDSE